MIKQCNDKHAKNKYNWTLGHSLLLDLKKGSQNKNKNNLCDTRNIRNVMRRILCYSFLGESTTNR